MSSRTPSRAALTLLRAVGDGQVVCRAGEGRDTRILRLDQGTNGRTATEAVRRLEARGWVRKANEPVGAEPFEVTERGRFWLDLDDPTYGMRVADAMPTLHQAKDEREPFDACDEGEPPSGAVIELDDTVGGGYWQRQGHEWVPVAEADALTVLGLSASGASGAFAGR